jgi:large subunit ribosomal protein L10
MTREEKVQEIEALKAKFEEYDNFYVVDAQGLTVDQVNNLRMKCHDAGVEYRVAKNSLIKKALEQIEGTNELSLRLFPNF